MDRCNLTVLLLPGYEDLVEFLAAHRVQVIASLPYYTDQPADAQRGLGVFSKSVQALRLLNARGYGMPGSELVLNLVYNPAGAFLPAPQPSLEADYKRELWRRHGIEFNSLYTITNMPISRFREFLDRTGNYERYMDKLANAFNPAAVAGLMCRNTLSVGWDGQLYDCDFNQMLELPIGHIRDFDALRIGSPHRDRRALLRLHCGAGIELRRVHNVEKPATRRPPARETRRDRFSLEVILQTELDVARVLYLTGDLAERGRTRYVAARGPQLT